MKKGIAIIGFSLLAIFLLSMTIALAYQLIVSGDQLHQFGKQLPRSSAASRWFLLFLFAVFDLLAIIAGIRWWRTRVKS